MCIFGFDGLIMTELFLHENVFIDIKKKKTHRCKTNTFSAFYGIKKYVIFKFRVM